MAGVAGVDCITAIGAIVQFVEADRYAVVALFYRINLKTLKIAVTRRAS